MFKASAALLLFGIAFFNLSCSDLEKQLGIKKTEDAVASVPVDESTAEERALIEDAVQRITTLAEQFGHDAGFKRIPIYVTTEDAIATGRWGYCQWDADNNGLFIVINRVVFLEDQDHSNFDYLFATLLHEIGHCYFRRQHESNLVRKEAFVIDVEVHGPEGSVVISDPGFPVSIMYVRTSELCRERCQIGLHPFAAVPEFQRYFVSEIVGADKIDSTTDLTRFRSLRWRASLP